VNLIINLLIISISLWKKGITLSSKSISFFRKLLEAETSNTWKYSSTQDPQTFSQSIVSFILFQDLFYIYITCIPNIHNCASSSSKVQGRTKPGPMSSLWNFVICYSKALKPTIKLMADKMKSGYLSEFNSQNATDCKVTLKLSEHLWVVNIVFFKKILIFLSI